MNDAEKANGPELYHEFCTDGSKQKFKNIEK